MQRIVAGDGDKKARSPGRARRNPLKPLARGMPGEPGVTVVTTLVCLFHFAHKAAGAVDARHSLRPSDFGAKGSCMARARSRCEEEKVCRDVIASASEAIQNLLRPKSGLLRRLRSSQ